MVSDFKSLKKDEIEIIINAPALVTMLVAGADDDVDKNEIKAAISFAKKKVSESSRVAPEYYAKIDQDLERRLKILCEELPKLVEEQKPQKARGRNANAVKMAKDDPMIIKPLPPMVSIVSVRLKQLNKVFPKLEKKVALDIYEFLLGLAKAVAESSGGIFGFRTISREESEVMKLDMIEDPSVSRSHQSI